MAISVGSDYLFSNQLKGTASNSAADKLSSKIGNLSAKNSSDEELMEACKSFEQYLVEQVMKSTKKAMIGEEEEKNQYMEYFGDTLYQEYAKLVSENSNLGIAKMLFESMKNNGNDN